MASKAIWLPAKAWSRKKSARHFEIARKSKQDTQIKAWLKKSKANPK